MLRSLPKHRLARRCIWAGQSSPRNLPGWRAASQREQVVTTGHLFSGRRKVQPARLVRLGLGLVQPWSRRHGRTIVEHMAIGEVDQLSAIFDEPWDILEVAAMSLGFEDAVTAIDLCADAVFLACGRPLRTLGGSTTWASSNSSTNTLPLQPPFVPGSDQLLQHADLPLLEDCRHPLTHRFVRRHIALGAGRGLSEITTLHGQDPSTEQRFNWPTDPSPRRLRRGATGAPLQCDPNRLPGRRPDQGGHAPSPFKGATSIQREAPGLSYRLLTGTGLGSAACVNQFRTEGLPKETLDNLVVVVSRAPNER